MWAMVLMEELPVSAVCKKVLPRLDKRVRKNYGQFTVTVVSR
jgi:hypothetical protein